MGTNHSERYTKQRNGEPLRRERHRDGETESERYRLTQRQRKREGKKVYNIVSLYFQIVFLFKRTIPNKENKANKPNKR
jgi:hypothetical protein